MNTTKKLIMSLAMLLVCATTFDAAAGYASITQDGIQYDFYFSGSGASAVGQYAEVPRQSKDFSGAANIAASVTYEYTYTDNGTTYTRKLTAPVTAINDDAFNECRSLTSVTIPNTVTTIGKRAFYTCYKLENVTIGNSVITIGESAFDECGLTSVVIPNSVTTIGNTAFAGCSSMTSVVIGESVESIPQGCFYGCRRLTSVAIPNSVKTIGKNAFYNCIGLVSATIGNSVEAIPNSCFYGCSSLTSVTMSYSPTSIGDKAFRGCSSLLSIDIPGSVTTIGNEAFYECNALKSVTIPNTVTAIGDAAFRDCRNLAGVTIPNSVTSIGNEAFYRCWSMTNLTLGNSVVSIGETAFYYCTALTSVAIPNSVITIAKDAFNQCTSLASMTLGNSVTTIGNGAFYGCSSLKSVNIPNSVTTIGNQAFWNCSSMTDLTIGNAVTTIGNSAFSSCTSLTSVDIPNSVTELGAYAFSHCTSLTSANITQSITQLHSGCFSNCTQLQGVTIPNSVDRIWNNAFESCYSLENVTIGVSVHTIDQCAFQDCRSLTSVTLPDSVLYIGERAFASCRSLESVYIGEALNVIYNEAFYDCTSLKSLTLGKSVAGIGKDAFQNASAIETITCKAVTPPSWSDYSRPPQSWPDFTVFTNSVYNNASLHVPTASEEAYKSSQYWGLFQNIIGSDDEPGDGYEYVPFVREGVKWTYSIQDYRYEKDYGTNPARGDNRVYRTLEFRGDTVINGKTYKAMHKCTDDVYSEPSDVIIVYLREEDKKVYGIVPDGIIYDDARICNTPFAIEDDAILAGEEFLLYDFQDPVTYWDNLFDDDSFNPQLQLDTIEVGGHYAKRLFYGGPEEVYFQVIEGIGATGMNSYPLAFFMPVSTGIHTSEYYSLEKVVENGEVIYPQDYVEDRYLPVIREGVKWVNKYVEINNEGDTTYHYYTYEFKDNYPERDSYNRVFKAVYTKNYDANGVAYGDERLVAGLREDEACILSFRNEPLSWMNNLINFYTYQGNEDVRLLYENLEGMWDIDYYINNQSYPHMNLLNTDNFVEAEPIVIDGFRCSRIAYIGEQGDTLAYLVEGIGFDSRDLGDLLTPFTRYPDADCGECYQEYCGLSHVVKDGKIIYKGLLYQDGVTVGIDDIDCDVNGDGSVNITDVDNVVVIIINGGNGHDRINEHGQIIGDVNHDGVVNISDLNLIINLIINN